MPASCVMCLSQAVAYQRLRLQSCQIGVDQTPPCGFI